MFKANHNAAKSEFYHNGITYDLIQFMSGVLTGCPGSDMLFNNALDPFLAMFHNALRSEKVGIIRACADDIGITLTMLKYSRTANKLQALH